MSLQNEGAIPDAISCFEIDNRKLFLIKIRTLFEDRRVDRCLFRPLACENRISFMSLPYVCPEQPVLVN